MKIFLIGFMGAGKSFIGKRLAGCLNFSFIDTDLYIERKFDLPISKIFSKYGETFFRNQEILVLKSIKHKENIVVATGGGLPCYKQNMFFIKQNGFSFYLKISPEALYKRLIKEKAHRPLIQNLNEIQLKNFIVALLHKREKKCYMQADFILNAEKDPKSITRDIIRLLNLSTDLCR